MTRACGWVQGPQAGELPYGDARRRRAGQWRARAGERPFARRCRPRSRRDGLARARSTRIWLSRERYRGASGGALAG